MNLDPAIQKTTEEGFEAFKAGRFTEAAHSFGLAATWYAEQGDLAMQAEMANNQSVAFLKANLPEEALRTAMGTDQIFANQNDRRREGIALANQAAAMEALGNLDRSTHLYRRSAEQLKQAGETQLRIISLQLLSTAHFRQGHFWEALGVKRQVLEEKETLSVPERILKKLLGAVFSLIQV